MRKLIPVALLLLVGFLSCSKNDTPVNCPQSNVFPTPPICSDAICASDTCQTYRTVWKELVMSANGMSEAFYDTHIALCEAGVYKNSNGFAYVVNYTIKLDWFEVKLSSQFQFWLTPDYVEQHPMVGLPSNVLLTKDQISTQIDSGVLAYNIRGLMPATRLRYDTKEDARNVLATLVWPHPFCGNIFYEFQNGHPIMAAYGQDVKNNECFNSQVDLVTGETQLYKNDCNIIIFCFVKGTQITLNNQTTKPIEKIRAGDIIASIDPITMKPEQDVVEQIDSVFHNDMVRIVFSDLTENKNTSDHPYYVKGKGWCSCSPLETERKYGIKTKQLLTGDLCFKYQDGMVKELPVISINKLNSGSVITYNISKLRKNKSYFANGVMVSNEANEKVTVRK